MSIILILIAFLLFSFVAKNTKNKWIVYIIGICAGSILTFYITLDYAENKIKNVEKQTLEYILSK